MDNSHFGQHHPYGAPDFRHDLLTNRPPFPPLHFPADSQAAAELFMSHPTSQHLEMMMMGHRPSGLCEFQPPAAASVGATGAATRLAGSGGGTSTTSVLEAESGGCVGGDVSNTRWPRQETLTLLEIRSRLDSRFREANQKGPLWDEVSRIMGEENGYQRSGKKCREKFENLYKYYKKTKEGKAGRQDGKNYRFFRQLEALYGDHTSTNAPASILDTQSLANSHPYQPSPIDTQLGCPNYNINQETTTSHDQSQKLCDSLSLSDYSSDFDTSSSDNRGWGETKLMGESASMGKKRRGRRSWKAKIKEFIDSKMRKVIEKQEAMVEKMMRTLEEKEQERVLREEEWKREEIARVEKEHKFWAQERAWIEARDVALMDALQNLTSKSDQDHLHHLHVVGAINHEIGTKGEGIERIVKKSKEYSSKKSKENLSRSCGYYNENNGNSLYNQGGISYREVNERGHDLASRVQLNDGSSPSNPNPNVVGNSVQESCLRFLMNEGESLWENYGLKMNKGGED